MKLEKKPSLSLSLVPVIVLVFLLIFNVYLYGDEATSGANQIALLTSGFLSALIGVLVLKIPYSNIEKKALESVGVSLQANIILLLVGSLIGTWILSGVVPAMIYYGVKLINPQAFLAVACVICSIVSLATGSSWSTAGTVGIALIGIGTTLGIPTPMVAGAIVSGAYFGDKMSPLSDTTNLAPAMAGTDLFSHVRHMVYTTTPAMLLAVIGYSILGYFYGGGTISTNEIDVILRAIDQNFHISPFLFILPIFVFWLVAKRMPAIPALFIGTLLGGVFAMIFQQDLISKLSGGDFSFISIYKLLTATMFDGFKIESGHELIDKLFSRGGMSSMLTTIWLILMAMVFGGMMEVTGMLATIAENIMKAVKGVTSLVAATVGSAIFLNITTSDQYISIVVTGRMFKDAYKKFNLHPKNLSRAVEDGATVTSVLVPWNTCGAYFSGILGVATLSYAPFAFFNLLSPISSIIIASTGKTMEKLEGPTLDA